MPRNDRSHLRLIRGGKYTEEARVARILHPSERRVVRAEPRPNPYPPKDAA